MSLEPKVFWPLVANAVTVIVIWGLYAVGVSTPPVEVQVAFQTLLSLLAGYYAPRQEVRA